MPRNLEDSNAARRARARRRQRLATMRVIRLGDDAESAEERAQMEQLSISERLALVWQLTAECYALGAHADAAQPRLQRSVFRVKRLGR